MSNQQVPLQDETEYKAEVITRLCSSQHVIGLLSNDPNIDLDSDGAYNFMDNCIFDFDYIDKTVERSDAFIMIDTDMISALSGSMNSWELYVQVVCHKNYMKLNPKTYKGVKGNRRDNLVSQIDALLNGTRAFGVGKLELQSCITAQVPDGFTSKMLTYRIVEYRKERFMQ